MHLDDSHDDDFGQDSFLDVVANVVGVLIILVMVIGASASQSLLSRDQVAVDAEIPPPAMTAEVKDIDALKVNLANSSRQAHALERELQKTAAVVSNIVYQAETQREHRAELAVYRSAVEQDLEKRRSALDEEAKRKFDVQNQIFQAKLQLDELTQRQLTLLDSPGEIEEIKVEPTPVAKKVDEGALHLRVLNGMVCKVPFYELKDALEYEIASIKRELSNSGSVNRMIGPISGFRLRMKTRRLSATGAVTGPQVGRLGNRDKLIPYYYFLADSDELGERVEQAMLPNSELREILQQVRRDNSVVVVWIYSDSFDEFRTLKKLLSEMSFSIAPVSLRLGEPIVIAPHGTEIVTQ